MNSIEVDVEGRDVLGLENWDGVLLTLQALYFLFLFHTKENWSNSSQHLDLRGFLKWPCEDIFKASDVKKLDLCA